MSGRFEERLEALEVESARAETPMRAAAADAFEAPTRCPAWDVRGLIGHMLRDVHRLLDLLQEPALGPPDTDSAVYFGSYDSAAEAPDIAERSIEMAARYATDDDLVEGFATTWRRAVKTAADAGHDRLVHVFSHTMVLPDYLETRVVEMTIHGLDLAAALHTERWMSVEGAAITRDVMSRMLGSAPPDGWDDVTFFEKGTGRAPLTDDDRRALGPTASRFPLFA